MWTSSYRSNLCLHLTSNIYFHKPRANTKSPFPYIIDHPPHHNESPLSFILHNLVILMYLRKVLTIFAFTLQSCSFPLDFLKRSDHLVIRARASYSVVDVDGNQAFTSTHYTSPVFETVVQTVKSKYTSTLTTNEPAGSRATTQGLAEILSAITLTVSRSKTICSDSTLVIASAVPISESALPPNPSYFIVNPESTPASPNIAIAIATTTITIKEDLRSYNTASALLPNGTNAFVRIFSRASPVAFAMSFSTILASNLPSNTRSRLQPSSTAVSVYEPTEKPGTSYDRVRSAPYHFPNITSTTSAGWKTKVHVV